MGDRFLVWNWLAEPHWKRLDGFFGNYGKSPPFEGFQKLARSLSQCSKKAIRQMGVFLGGMRNGALTVARRIRRGGWENHAATGRWVFPISRARGAPDGGRGDCAPRDFASHRRLGSRKFSYGSLDRIRHWRSFNRVHFVETPVFTKQITALLDDGDYRQLQVTLALKPAAGDLIRGSGGLRKVRWAVRGRGKSGGIRVIYYLVDEGEIYFLLAYAKNEQEDLDSRQLRVLRNLVKEEFE